jgi:hypothetical protein
VEWWLIVAKIITGFTNGFLYVAEAAAMMTYPQVHERGKYLSKSRYLSPAICLLTLRYLVGDAKLG